GNVYVSDSFRGIIWRTGPAGGLATAWVTDLLLTTTAVPPFGANGLAFNRSQTALFVANTGNDTVVKIPVSGSPLVAGKPFVFVTTLSLDLGAALNDPSKRTVDSPWAAQVTTHTISRINAHLPPIQGLP